MGKNSDLHIQYQEELAMTEEPSLNELLLDDQIRLLEKPVLLDIPYMERHATLLQQRTLYTDLVALAKQHLGTSLDKEYWAMTFQRRSEKLYLIESELLEVESAAS